MHLQKNKYILFIQIIYLCSHKSQCMIYTYICTHIYAYIYVYIYIYIHIYSKQVYVSNKRQRRIYPHHTEEQSQARLCTGRAGSTVNDHVTSQRRSDLRLISVTSSDGGGPESSLAETGRQYRGYSAYAGLYDELGAYT